MDFPSPKPPPTDLGNSQESSLSSSISLPLDEKCNSSSSLACPNCTKVAFAVRDWQAFTKRGEDAHVDIAPYHGIKATANDCVTCKKLDTYLSSPSVHFEPLEDECVVAIRLARNRDDWDLLCICSVCQLVHL